MALTNKLSAIGDAIREKTGKADKLTLDQMPLEIASIVSGGGSDGGASGISAISMGEITYSGRQTIMTIEHGLGVKPDAIFVYVPGFTFPTNGEVNLLGFLWVGYPYHTNSGARESSAVSMTTATNTPFGFGVNNLQVTVTETNFEAGRPSSVYYYNSGLTFRWCAVKFAEV